MNRKIVVLTPVKNEEWILEAFLKTTSCFANHIILADQHSTDRTLEIAAAFPKAIVIKNDSENFNEAGRQQLLIQTARKLYGAGNILLAIDADEIISYNSLSSAEWEEIQQAKPGTALFFEKPTFFNGLDKVIRYEKEGGWPLGVIDDGTEHRPNYIHSVRVPLYENAPRLYLKDIKFLHCNLLSLKRQRAKIRYYCMLESLAKSKSWHHRTLLYNRHYQYVREGDGLLVANVEWTKGWIDEKISLDQAGEEDFFWYDKECLKLFKEEGCRRFWMEDVWDTDWEKAKLFYKIQDCEITQPPVPFTFIRNTVFSLLSLYALVKKSSLKLQSLFLPNARSFRLQGG